MWKPARHLGEIVKHATLDDLRQICKHFQKRKDVFPHVRQDRLKRRIQAHQCVYQQGVVITYQQYKKRTRVGDVLVPAGAIMLHQILNTDQFNGAGRKVLRQFVAEIVERSGGDLYLTVRKENRVACGFYERHGMRIAGTVAWKKRTILGLVYRLSPRMTGLARLKVGTERSSLWYAVIEKPFLKDRKSEKSRCFRSISE
jgi:FR47-like protein